MAHYDALLDDEIRAFIRRSGSIYPADAATLDIAGQRAVYDALCRKFHRG